jgi:hypothetical protein
VPRRLPAQTPCQPVHRSSQKRRSVEVVRHLGCDLPIGAAAADSLDRSRAAEVSQRARLGRPEHARADVAEIVAERVFRIGASRPIAENRRGRGDVRAEIRQIRIDDAQGAAAERAYRRPTCLGPIDMKSISLTV